MENRKNDSKVGIFHSLKFKVMILAEAFLIIQLWDVS